MENELLNPEPEKDWQAIAVSLAKELGQRKEAENKDKEFLEKIEATKGSTPFEITPEREKLLAERGLWKPTEKPKSLTDKRWYSQPTERQLEIIKQKQKEQGYQL